MATVLTAPIVVLGRSALNPLDAVDQTGSLIVDSGLAATGFDRLLVERQGAATGSVGHGVALIDGGPEGDALVSTEAVVIVQFPSGVPWPKQPVYLLIGAVCRYHRLPAVLPLLSLLSDEAVGHRLRTADRAVFQAQLAAATDRSSPVQAGAASPMSTNLAVGRELEVHLVAPAAAGPIDLRQALAGLDVEVVISRDGTTVDARHDAAPSQLRRWSDGCTLRAVGPGAHLAVARVLGVLGSVRSPSV